MPDSEDLRQVPIDEIRSRRTVYMSEETGLSYLRRMVQGPLDIVRHEQELRARGSASDLASMIEGLPGVLADGPRTGGNGRLSQELEPHHIDPELEAELETIMGNGRLSSLAGLTDDGLALLAGRLEEFERRVSEQRHGLHLRIDALQAELTRRYQTGEASVDSLLS